MSPSGGGGRDKIKLTPSYLLEYLGLHRRVGKTVIGMQLAGDVLRVLEIDRSVDPPRVGNFSAIDPLMENLHEAADQVLGLLHEKGMTGRVAHVTIYDQESELRQVNLPVLGGSEMDAVVRRELKKIKPDTSPAELAYDYWYDPGVKKGRKADMLVGVAAKESVRRVIALMEQCELDTELITTVPMSLIATLGVMGEGYRGKVVASIHLERGRSYLVISRDGDWVFSREFQSVLNREEEQREDQEQPLSAKRKFASAKYLADLDKLLIEVNRSLLYFKQRFRGEGVTAAVLSGEAFNLEDTTASFKENLGIEAEVFRPMEAFDTGRMGDRAGKLERIFPSLALPLGAALQTGRGARLNFVPDAYLNRYKERVRKVVLGAVAALLVLALGTGYLLVRNTRVELERILAQNRQEETIAQMKAKLDDIAEVNRQRQLAERRSRFLRQFEPGRGPLDDLLLTLSHIVPPEMLLHNLAVREDSLRRSAEIVGQVEGMGIAASDSTFNVFYQKLIRSGLFLNVAEPRLSAVDEEGERRLSFQVIGELPS